MIKEEEIKTLNKEENKYGKKRHILSDKDFRSVLERKLKTHFEPEGPFDCGPINMVRIRFFSTVKILCLLCASSSSMDQLF